MDFAASTLFGIGAVYKYSYNYIVDMPTESL